jgi:hypothetical protein
MRKYQTNVGTATIKPVEASRETETSVFFLVGTKHDWEARADKISEKMGYFDTFEEARAFLLEKLEWNVAALIRSMDREMDKIEAVKEMKEA